MISFLFGLALGLGLGWSVPEPDWNDLKLKVKDLFKKDN